MLHPSRGVARPSNIADFLSRRALRAGRPLQLSRCEFLAELEEGEANRIDGVRVVAVRWPARYLKVWPFVVHSPPLGVGVADELLQELLGCEHSLGALLESDERPVVVAIEQGLSEVAK